MRGSTRTWTGSGGSSSSFVRYSASSRTLKFLGKVPDFHFEGDRPTKENIREQMSICQVLEHVIKGKTMLGHSLFRREGSRVAVKGPPSPEASYRVASTPPGLCTRLRRPLSAGCPVLGRWALAAEDRGVLG